MSFSTKVQTPEEIYLQELQKRQFTDHDAKHCGLDLLTPDETQSLLGHTYEYAIKIPYFDVNGIETDFCRVKILMPKSKSYRYSQRSNSGSQIYFTRDSIWQTAVNDVNIPIIITEGELKAFTITKHLKNDVYAVLGLAGVTSWSDKSGLPMHKDLMQIRWKAKGPMGTSTAREVYIIFDYDGKEANGEPNAQVQQAESRLAITLAGLGANVHMCRVGRNQQIGIKYAIDDHLNGGGLLVDVLESGDTFKFAQNSRDMHLYRAKTQWGIYNGEWVRLDDGKRFSGGKIAVELANQHWVEQVIVNNQPRDKEKLLYVEYARWSKRLSLNGLGMYPQYQGQMITPDGKYNYMKDWTHQPIPGAVDVWLEWCKYFFQDAPEFEDFFHNWVANIIQFPWRRNNTAIQIISDVQGIGKSFTNGWIAKMIGDMALSIGPDQIFHKFNSHISKKIFLAVDEPSSDKDDHSNKLKDLITGDAIAEEGKGIDVVMIDNYVNYAFTTNKAFVTRVSEGSRREAIYSPQSLTQEESHRRIQEVKEWCKGSGFNHMMHFYMTRDISAFDHQAPAPDTKHKEQVVNMSRTAWGQFAHELIDWVNEELGGYAAFNRSQINLLIRIWDYGNQVKATNISHSLQEVCSLEMNKLIKVDGVPNRRYLITPKRQKRDTNSIKTDTLGEIVTENGILKHGAYSEIAKRSDKAIEKLVALNPGF